MGLVSCNIGQLYCCESTQSASAYSNLWPVWGIPPPSTSSLVGFTCSPITADAVGVYFVCYASSETSQYETDNDIPERCFLTIIRTHFTLRGNNTKISTFHILILEMQRGIFEAESTNGNTHLAGEDFDIALKFFLDEPSHTAAWDKATLELPSTTQAEVCKNQLVNRTVALHKKAFNDADLGDRQVHIRSRTKGFNPDEVVAIGASIQGVVLTGVLIDVTSLLFGIETFGDIMAKLINHNASIPTMKS
ncbi:hypothetical protein ID866_7421 [Astraeus odoratus]|nr:hypothetical protein ID866_7421 [Astraeus odoratus]